MHGSYVPKAERLQRLATVVSVPQFIVVRRDERYEASSLFDAERYMVRGAVHHEDTSMQSRAGQSPTRGPISRHGIECAVADVFHDTSVQDVIIQKFAAEEVYGVAFCFSPENMFVEYSGIFEGVTGGITRPFVALLPSSLEKYAALQAALTKIYDAFGPCDVEFAGLVRPQFVQVRPITRSFSVNGDLETMKMHLQEFSESRWVDNDICRVIAEHDAQSAAYITHYINAARRVFKKYFGRAPVVPQKPFLKIGTQYFMAYSLCEQLLPRVWERIKFGFFLERAVRAIPSSPSPSDNAIETLFDRSMILSLAHAFTKREDLFIAREEYRARIDVSLPRGVFPADFFCARPLAEEIAMDHEKKAWKKIAQRSEEGIAVVEGDLTTGPFFMLNDPTQNIPHGTIVLTEHLYPALSVHVPFLKGIVCEYGALTSHVAIVAREHGIPLKIQTPLSSYGAQ